MPRVPCHAEQGLSHALGVPCHAVYVPCHAVWATCRACCVSPLAVVGVSHRRGAAGYRVAEISRVAASKRTLELTIVL